MTNYELYEIFDDNGNSVGVWGPVMNGGDDQVPPASCKRYWSQETDTKTNELPPFGPVSTLAHAS